MNVEKYIEERARKEWDARLTKANHAVDEILSCIRCGNRADMRPLFNAFGSPTTGGQSDYGVRKGMIEHLIFTLIAVRDWDAKRIDSPNENPFHQADAQSFKPDVIGMISVSIMGAMEEAMQDDNQSEGKARPQRTVTVTGEIGAIALTGANMEVTHGDDE